MSQASEFMRCLLCIAEDGNVCYNHAEIKPAPVEDCDA